VNSVENFWFVSLPLTRYNHRALTEPVLAWRTISGRSRRCEAVETWDARKHSLKIDDVDDSEGEPLHPDGLPVGFVADSGVRRKWLGLTCAACHTNEIRYGTTAYRVDGAPTQGDVRALLSAMITAMQKTRDDPAKLGRLAAKVLGNQNNTSGQLIFRAQLAAAIDKRIAYNLRDFPGYNPNEPDPHRRTARGWTPSARSSTRSTTTP
jgi:hypothetical protein